MLGRIDRFKKLRWHHKLAVVLLLPIFVAYWLMATVLDYVVDLFDVLNGLCEETHGN